MHIVSLSARNWRGLDELVLDELSPHLNLIAGPNESGKSRLVEALRFALFESTKGKAAFKQALATWGGGAAQPQVELVFDLGGARWQLKKVFLGSGHDTQLRGPGGTLDGEAAELHLAQLLDVAPGGSKEAKDEDKGIWPLLWVAQGHSREVPTGSAGAGAHAVLEARLSDEIGEVASGPVAQQVLEAARAHCAHFYTTAKGQETGELKGLREVVEAAQAAQARAQADHDAVQHDADALQREREREASLTERRDAASMALEAIRDRAAEAAEAQRSVALGEERLHTARSALQRAEAQQQRADELTTALASNRDAQAQATLALQATGERLDAAATALQQRQAAVADAEAAHAGARTRLAQRRLVAQRAELTAERERLQASRTELLQRIEARRARQDALARLPEIDAEGVAQLRERRARLDTLRATLEGVATRITLHARRDLQLDGETLPAETSRALLVDEDRRIVIDGVVTIEVAPGGGELTQLREALGDATEQWREACTRLGVDADDGAQAAAALLQQRRDLVNEVQRLDEDMRTRWPEGFDALDARLQALAEQLTDTSGPAGDSEADAALPESVAAAEADVTAAEEAREAARARRDLAAEAHAELRPEAVRLEEQQRARAATQATLQAQLDALPEADALRRSLDEAREGARAAQEAHAAARQAFEALGGERLATEVQQAEQALAGLEAQLRSSRDERVRLQARLEDVGGHFETLQAAAEQHERSVVELSLVERQALAARRLLEVLDAAHQASRQRLAAPVIRRITPWLGDVFPNASLWLDDDLALQGLRSAEVDEAFEALSGGAREQLALLVRLGLADVLAGDGEGWPLVLDDVLVNTDPERIRRVQRALFDASRRVQVLLFTCHGELFDPVGADRRIELPLRRR